MWQRQHPLTHPPGWLWQRTRWWRRPRAAAAAPPRPGAAPQTPLSPAAPHRPTRCWSPPGAAERAWGSRKVGGGGGSSSGGVGGSRAGRAATNALIAPALAAAPGRWPWLQGLAPSKPSDDWAAQSRALPGPTAVDHAVQGYLKPARRPWESRAGGPCGGGSGGSRRQGWKRLCACQALFNHRSVVPKPWASLQQPQP